MEQPCRRPYASPAASAARPTPLSTTLPSRNVSVRRAKDITRGSCVANKGRARLPVQPLHDLHDLVTVRLQLRQTLRQAMLSSFRTPSYLLVLPSIALSP